MTSARAANVRGFTLIEVLIAMALFSVIGLASYGLFSAVTDGDRLAKEHLTKLNQMQTAFLVIERDFVQLTMRSVRLDGNEPRKDFLYTMDSSFSETSGIAFVRQGWRNPGLLLARSDLQPVAYLLEDGNLVRNHYNYVDPAVGTEPKVRVLLEGITALSFEYYYGDKWDDKLQSGTLPKAIAFIVESEQLGIIRRNFLIPNEPTES